MPINFNINLGEYLSNKYIEFISNSEINSLFLRNLSKSFNNDDELIFCLINLDISEYHMKLLTSKDHEKK